MFENTYYVTYKWKIGHLTLVMKSMIGLKAVPFQYLWAFMSAMFCQKTHSMLAFFKY